MKAWILWIVFAALGWTTLYFVNTLACALATMLILLSFFPFPRRSRRSWEGPPLKPPIRRLIAGACYLAVLIPGVVLNDTNLLLASPFVGACCVAWVRQSPLPEKEVS